MNYLITQMWACLLIAAAIGILIGWLLRGISNRKSLEKLDETWQRKFEQKENQQTAGSTESIKPIAKTTASTPKGLQPNFDVEEIEGIGKSYGGKLRDIGITTSQHLLDKCGDLDGRIEIANHIGIEDFVIQKWASMADLMRISEIDGQWAELMVYSGIDSVQALGEQNVDNFFTSLSKANNEQQRVKTLPDATLLEIMIAEAKSLPSKLKDI